MIDVSELKVGELKTIIENLDKDVRHLRRSQGAVRACLIDSGVETFRVGSSTLENLHAIIKELQERGECETESDKRVEGTRLVLRCSRFALPYNEANSLEWNVKATLEYLGEEIDKKRERIAELESGVDEEKLKDLDKSVRDVLVNSRYCVPHRIAKTLAWNVNAALVYLGELIGGKNDRITELEKEKENLHAVIVVLQKRNVNESSEEDAVAAKEIRDVLQNNRFDLPPSLGRSLASNVKDALEYLGGLIDSKSGGIAWLELKKEKKSRREDVVKTANTATAILKAKELDGIVSLMQMPFPHVGWEGYVDEESVVDNFDRLWGSVIAINEEFRKDKQDLMDARTELKKERGSSNLRKENDDLRERIVELGKELQGRKKTGEEDTRVLLIKLFSWRYDKSESIADNLRRSVGHLQIELKKARQSEQEARECLDELLPCVYAKNGSIAWNIRNSVEDLQEQLRKSRLQEDSTGEEDIRDCLERLAPVSYDENETVIHNLCGIIKKTQNQVREIQQQAIAERKGIRDCLEEWDAVLYSPSKSIVDNIHEVLGGQQKQLLAAVESVGMLRTELREVVDKALETGRKLQT